jgi:hypothetical protein
LPQPNPTRASPPPAAQQPTAQQQADDLKKQFPADTAIGL